jgi:predicted outer membrane protein
MLWRMALPLAVALCGAALWFNAAHPATAAASVVAGAPSAVTTPYPGGPTGNPGGAQPGTTGAPPPPVSGALPQGWTLTPYGPLSPADRDLLVRVRQAGLWEMPAGDMAQVRSQNPKVKQVGQELHNDHVLLDQKTRDLAAQLNVPLPDQPNSDQQGWLVEMSGKTGPDFDATYDNRLRAAHGKIFSIIAGVRAGTQNDAIRAFATVANTFVMKHMTLLESIGMVNYQALPPPPPPVSPTPGLNALVASLPGGSRVLPTVIWIFLVLLVVGIVKWKILPSRSTK